MKRNTKNKTNRLASFKTLLRVFKDMKQIRWMILAIVLISVAGVGISLATPSLLGELTDALYNLWAQNKPILQEDFVKKCYILGGIYLLSAILSIISMIINTNAVSRYFTYGLRVRISSKITRLPVAFADRTPTGEILSRMMADVSNMSAPIYDIIYTIIDGFVKLVGISIIIFILNPELAIVIVCVVPLSVALATVLSSKSEKMYNEYRQTNGEIYALTEEDFTGFDTVKTFGLEEERAQKFSQKCHKGAKQFRRAENLSKTVNPLIVFTNAIAYILICVIGGYMAINGTLNVGTVVSLVLYAQMFAGPLESISMGLSQIQNTVASANRVYEIFDSEEMPKEGAKEEGELENYKVTFSKVAFSYDKAKPLIKNLTFNVEEGQKVAIVGATGAGKTTIVNLLMRFYEIDGGAITVGGKDITKIPREQVRSYFSMVLQDTWLFSGSIFENVALGKEGASLQEVQNACKKAHIDGYINSLPDGYNTVINEETTNISGGQKQLLTIARAYLADRKILILDEATSNVDTRTELLIQQTMDELMSNRTSFVIAHRLSTIVNADVILVVDNGDIVEQGTHAQLLQKGGLYSKIYNSQYDGTKIEA
ncbi:MAG: ABC transporter ATP-binding protein [Clostridia bacterium]|nr:ABC transporter ATP-binding protein [Clostridia bacterium]